MERIQIVMGDITKSDAQAIVNAANTSLLGGGGVDGAIHRAAGPELLEECRQLHGCPTGGAKITRGYRLPAEYVIHTVGPRWHGGDRDEDRLLESCYVQSLRLAREKGISSIDFPSISTGAYRFPLERAAAIAVKTLARELEDCPEIKRARFCCFDERTRAAYQQALDSLER